MSTASQFAFQPLGPTHLIASDTPAPTPVQINVRETTTGVGQYRIVNSSSTDIVFVGFGATAAQATAGAAAIVAGTPSNTLVMLPGAVEIVRSVNNAFVTSFSAAAADVYITPGQGL
jgi:hypothetical protein